MKNARIQPLILITCIFAAFVTGLFLGRNSQHAPVQIQPIPTVSVPVATAEEQPAELAVVNINTATSEHLQALPTIGPVLAERIIAYRNEHGGFHSVGELVNVPGIGEKTLEKLWDLITIGG